MFDDTPPKRAILAAFKGNKQAMTEILAWALPKARSKVTNLQQEIDHRRAEEWDPSQAREMAMAGEVTTEMTEAALSDIFARCLNIVAYLPMVLTAEVGDAEAMEQLLRQEARGLLVMLANPTYKYSIIGAFPPEVREDAEQYYETLGRELLETLEVITREDEITADDFPEETAFIIKSVGDAMSQPTQEGGAD